MNESDAGAARPGRPLSYVARRPELLLLVYCPLLGCAYCRPDRPLAEKYQRPVAQAQLAALDLVLDEDRRRRLDTAA
ncbi:hypothetical protein ACFVTF_02115 [Kitasatospora sp. NPDC057940]|uniref:hypothetical protein n=1 Tax=Kitasatospora sp. NPDC057940 TaxID=3346285 RepID=UPI0036DC19C2